METAKAIAAIIALAWIVALEAPRAQPQPQAFTDHVSRRSGHPRRITHHVEKGTDRAK